MKEKRTTLFPLDTSSFRIFFESTFNALCSFAYRYVVDRLLSEDIVQEAFISLWEKRSEFENELTAKAYLYTTVRNKCLNQIKHLSVVKKHEEKLIYELESEHFFTQHVIEEESFNQLYHEIQQLPPSAQQIMLLALKGLKNKEIAKTLNISENTVKTQKKIAYAKLKEKLSPKLFGILLSL